MKTAVFNKITGEIHKTVCASQSVAHIQAQIGENWVACAEDTNDLKHWINPITLLREDRPVMPGTLDKPQILADGNDLATISNLPQPCTVTFKGQQYPVEDGSFSFTANIPGSYTVEVEAFPYLPATFTVEAI